MRVSSLASRETCVRHTTGLGRSPTAALVRAVSGTLAMHTKSGQLLVASRVTGSRLLQQRDAAAARGRFSGEAAT
jgi:hypothetical protein